MELTNQFSVPAPVDQVWQLLDDIERVAACVPGAELREVEGEEYQGTFRVTVGPVTAHYEGTARFLRRNERTRRAVIRAQGRDIRGQGDAEAIITALLTPDGDATVVTLLTDLSTTGKISQFGASMMTDVAAQLLRDLVICLEASGSLRLAVVPSGPATAGPAIDLGDPAAAGAAVPPAPDPGDSNGQAAAGPDAAGAAPAEEAPVGTVVGEVGEVGPEASSPEPPWEGPTADVAGEAPLPGAVRRPEVTSVTSEPAAPAQSPSFAPPEPVAPGLPPAGPAAPPAAEPAPPARLLVPALGALLIVLRFLRRRRRRRRAR